MSEGALKLIGECSKERLPSYVERLILDVKSELGDNLTNYDLTVVLLFGLMAETGFTPLSPDDVPTGLISPIGSNFDTQKLNAIQKMPKNWRNPTGSSYSIKFHLNQYQDSICQFLASKIEAGTNTVSIEDNLIVNLFVARSPTAKAIHVQPSRYVASKNADIPDMFDKLDELSMLFKNAVHPLRNTILEEYGRLNASLIGIPIEMKLKIFEYLSVPDGWKPLSETCTELHILGNDSMLWKYYLKRDFGSIASHRVSVDELSRATGEINWKSEYVASYVINAIQKRPLLARGPYTRFEITSRDSKIAEATAQPEDAISSQERILSSDADLWSSASEDDLGIDVAERSAQWPQNMGEYFEDEDVMQRFYSPMETLAQTPHDGLLSFSSLEDGSCDVSYDSGYESDGHDSEIERIDDNKSTMDRSSGLRGFKPSSGVANWFQPYTSTMFRCDLNGRKTVFSGTKPVKNSWASTNLTRRMLRLEDARRGVYCDDRTELGAMSSATGKLKDAEDTRCFNKTFTSTKLPEAIKEAKQDPDLGDFLSDVRFVQSSHALQEYRSLQASKACHPVDETEDTMARGLEDLDFEDSGNGIFVEGSGNFEEYVGLLPPEEPCGVQDPFEFNSDQHQIHLNFEEYEDLPTPEEVLGVQHTFQLTLNEIQSDFGNWFGLPLSGEIVGVQDPFEFETNDVDAASVQNNNGSEPDLVGVLQEVERNGKGDADYLGGVVPSEYTYREVGPGEPYV